MTRIESLNEDFLESIITGQYSITEKRNKINQMMNPGGTSRIQF